MHFSHEKLYNYLLYEKKSGDFTPQNVKVLQGMSRKLGEKTVSCLVILGALLLQFIH